MLTRRNFFRRALSLTAAGSLARLGMTNAFAASSGDYKALVCVFLFGGNDSNNMLVPLDSAGYSNYNSIRKNLALAANTLLPIQTASGAAFGLHPRLTDLQTLFSQQKLAFVANVGSLVEPITRDQYINNNLPVPENLFSHADQQTQWQTSIPEGQSTTGWAGRLADQVAALNAPATFPTFVTVTGNGIFGTGASTSAGSVIPGAKLGLTGFDTSAASTARENALQALLTLDSGATLIQQAQSLMTGGLQVDATLTQAFAGAPALQTVFPKTTLGAQLQQVAQLIQMRQTLGMNRQIFFCSLNGFDTHTAELTTQDTLFGQLGPALGAFFAATQELGVDQDVVTFTESDFSRTFQPNTNGGTDHAWGSHHLVIGSAVQGGNLFGTFPALQLNGPDDAGDEGRWIPTTSIDQYGATLASWFGVSPSSLGTVFPNLQNFTTRTLTFLGS